MSEGQRFNEDLYEGLRTLEALTKTGDTVPNRLANLVRLLTRIRTEAPELWAQIEEFARRIK